MLDGAFFWFSRRNEERENTKIHLEHELNSVDYMGPVKEKTVMMKKVNEESLYSEEEDQGKLAKVVEENLMPGGDSAAFKTFVDS